MSMGNGSGSSKPLVLCARHESLNCSGMVRARRGATSVSQFRLQPLRRVSLPASWMMRRLSWMIDERGIGRFGGEGGLISTTDSFWRICKMNSCRKTTLVAVFRYDKSSVDDAGICRL
jgi:hypothetical protein